jgi:1-acyl-sn-glycerol-3-phosphate acyltransferase
MTGGAKKPGKARGGTKPKARGAAPAKSAQKSANPAKAAKAAKAANATKASGPAGGAKPEAIVHSRAAVSRAIEEAAAAAKKVQAQAQTPPLGPAAPETKRTVAAAEPLLAVGDEPTEPPPPPSSPKADGGAVATRIRELEARLDRMIDESARSHEPTARLAPPAPPSSVRLLPAEGEPTVFDTARELLSTDFYLRKWGRLGMRNRSEEVDDFGFDPVYEEKVLPIFDFLYDKYFRVECEGADNIPSEGRCLLVANHSGTIPYDGVMMKLAVKKLQPAKRAVRWLAEDFIFHFPFLGSFSNRVGAVRACQENAERLLRKESLVAVFPEGVKGIGKLFKERYRLQRFGRGGFIKLCLRTGTPIVPVAIVGAEEANPMLGRIEYLSKAIGVPYIPVTPTFPWLGPLGLVPAPTKWKIAFGEKVDFAGYGAEAAEDEILVGRLAEQVRGTIQTMLDRAVGERRSVFFG